MGVRVWGLGFKASTYNVYKVAFEAVSESFSQEFLGAFSGSEGLHQGGFKEKPKNKKKYLNKNKKYLKK